MPDPFDTPVGEFDWGPHHHRHRARDAISGAISGKAARRFLPWLSILGGMALLATGIALVIVG